MENQQKVTGYYQKKRIFLFLVILCCCIFTATLSASEMKDYIPGKNSHFSLLTASPGIAVYKQYGHTGIRFYDPDRPVDIVFNYGLFDFSSPNFIWRFITGKTDYVVATYSFYDFLLEYQMENRSVTEQVLNLTPKERYNLWDALMKNITPNNRVYRYNFFYKDCSTMPRDIIERSINGTVDYQWKGKYKSLRDEVHSFTANYPWTQFGIDFALGAEADEDASLRVQQFAPDVLMESFSKAVIRNNSTGVRSLVIETLHPAKIDPDQVEKSKSYLGPILVMWVVFFIILFFTWLEIKNKKPNYLLNAILYTIAGIIGLLIAFLVFISEHPTTEVNYLLLWLHPLYLFYLPALMVPAFRKTPSFIFSAINVPLQTFALSGALFLPQCLHPAAYPFLLALMLRTVSGWFFYKNNR